jgi:hypothetical protein
MQKFTTEIESNILQRINQLKHELNNKISYYNGNINNNEIVRISRTLDMLIIEYHERNQQ